MEDDKLKQILQNIVIPEPSQEKKKTIINKALSAFDENYQNNTQGNQKSLRLMDITHNLRSIFMNKKYYKYGSTTAIALICGIFIADIEKAGNQPQPVEGQKQVELPLLKQDRAPVVQDMVMPQAELSRDKDRLVVKEGAEKKVSAAPMIMPPSPPAEELDMLSSKPMPDAAMAKGGNVIGAAPMAAPSGLYAPKKEMAPVMQYQTGDKFEEAKTNNIKLVGEEPVSTFSIDVDTSSYSFVRRQLNYGILPDKDAVRIEEMVNYFDYNYALPEDKSAPFKPSINVMPSPWKKGNQLVHIGIKGYDILPANKPHSNLVFLIDTSGSMESPDKLPLLRNSFGLLVDTLDRDDTVSIVTYAGSAGTVLEPTKASDKQKILSALGNLYAGGSTAGAEGIKQAYALAEKNFDKEGVNRVILATDGDFNVGISDPEQLKEYIAEKRKTGVFLSVLGFGEGNYNDELMQKLAQNGNGNAAYIDNINEARKVLVDEASSTLFTIAKDVKIQVEFNPKLVSEYRLVGYETRMLNREDFNNDKVDAGEIGSGHAVTAIYEITPKGAVGSVDPLRYGAPEDVSEDKSVKNNEIGSLKIRYKLPNEDKSKLITNLILADSAVDDISKTTTDARFAVAVAAFGQLLKGETYVGDFTYDDIIKIAEAAKGEDKFGYRAEFINLVKSAKIAKATSTTSSGVTEY